MLSLWVNCCTSCGRRNSMRIWLRVALSKFNLNLRRLKICKSQKLILWIRPRHTQRWPLENASSRWRATLCSSWGISRSSWGNISILIASTCKPWILPLTAHSTWCSQSTISAPSLRCLWKPPNIRLNAISSLTIKSCTDAVCPGNSWWLSALTPSNLTLFKPVLSSASKVFSNVWPREESWKPNLSRQVAGTSVSSMRKINHTSKIRLGRVNSNVNYWCRKRKTLRIVKWILKFIFARWTRCLDSIRFKLRYSPLRSPVWFIGLISWRARKILASKCLWRGSRCRMRL